MAYGVTGIDRLKDQLEDFRREVTRAAAEALEVEADRVIARAVELAPRATGELRDSAYVKTPISPTRDSTIVSIELGFSAEHSLIVHEDLSARHTVGGAKFMSRAVDEALPGMRQRLEEVVRDALERTPEMTASQGYIVGLADAIERHHRTLGEPDKTFAIAASALLLLVAREDAAEGRHPGLPN